MKKTAKINKIHEKIKLLDSLNTEELLRVEVYYDIFEKCDILKNKYSNYSTTHPIDCDIELKRLTTADYDTCCALLTMLLREDHFCNGSFERRQMSGQVKSIIERILMLLSKQINPSIKRFLEKSLEKLNGYYVYALLDPITDKVFYIGKGTGNRVFSHELESGKNLKSEKAKLKRIREIESKGYDIKRVIINWGLSEQEAFASEASLINFVDLISPNALTNIVAGHHVHQSITVEEFEKIYGAENLRHEDIKHGLLVIKINKLYDRNMSSKELYDAVRGTWRASLNTINKKKIKYVLGVYNQLIVAVYKPDEWHRVYEMVDVPRKYEYDDDSFFQKNKERVYFICKDFENIDEEGRFYLYKSISELKLNQSSQNPISYITPQNIIDK